MWFRDTGEVWATQAGVSARYNNEKQFYGDDLCEYWATFLWYALNQLERNGGRGPYAVKLGVTGLDGTVWPGYNRGLGRAPLALEEYFEYDFTTNSIAKEDWWPSFEIAWAGLRRVYSQPAPPADTVEEIMRKCR